MTNTKAQKFGPKHSVPLYTVQVRGEAGCAMTADPAQVDVQIACYLSSRPQGTVEVLYSEQCAKCSGSGRLFKRRRTLFGCACPECSGVGWTYGSELIRTVNGTDLSR